MFFTNKTLINNVTELSHVSMLHSGYAFICDEIVFTSLLHSEEINNESCQTEFT